MFKNIKSKSARRGFTIIEMVVALMILASSVLILSRMKSGNRKRVDKAQYYHKAVLLLERKMAELEFKWSQQNFSSIPEEQNGVFKNEKDFSWSLKTKPFVQLPAEEIIKSLGAEDNTAMYIARTTAAFLSLAVKEAQLTVYYKKGAKRRSAYSLTAYIVDYKRQINLTNPGGP